MDFLLLSGVDVHYYEGLILVLTIYNEGAYLTFKSIFQKAINLF